MICRTKLIFSFISVLLLLSSCNNKKEKTQPIQENISESVYASGIVKSRNQYQVFSTANGLAQQLFVTEGDTVKKGDPLILVLNETSKLNTANARLAAEYAAVSANTEKLNELKINIDLARSKLTNDSLLLQRQQNLWAQQIGTRDALEQRELSVQNSATAYKSALLKYNELQKQLKYSAQQAKNNLQISNSLDKDLIIRSEVDGKVYSLLKEQGEMISIQTPVAIIGDAGDFILELQVDEYDIASIRLGQKVLVNMDSYKGKVFEASVTKINPFMNERSRSFTIEAGFVTRPPVLYPNLTTEANIIIQTKEKALTIPRSYLLNDSFILLENKEKRKVVTGLKDYQKVEIKSGLTVNDIILKPGK